MITTLVGLWLAIPAIAIFGIFRNRLSRLVLEVGIYSERLMSRFQNVGAKKAGPRLIDGLPAAIGRVVRRSRVERLP